MPCHNMPGKVNRYIKHRAVTVIEMNGGEGITVLLTVPVSPEVSGMVMVCSAYSADDFLLSVSKCLLFINHYSFAGCFKGK